MPANGAPRGRLILNPVAGRDTGPDHLLAIYGKLHHRFRALEVVPTTAEGDAREAARQAALDGCERLFVAGGDGTLNEAINGTASVDGGLDMTTFGLVPLGTGNDFASTLAIPDSVEEAVAVALDGCEQRVDLGRANDRVFVNVSGGGFIAEVSDAVPPGLKSVAGRLAYLIGGAEAVWSFEPVGVHIDVRDPVAPEGGRVPIPSNTARTDLYAFAVCNAPLVGGGKPIAPHAAIDDGRLDVCLLHAASTLDFLALLRRVAAGQHVADERVVYFQASTVTLRFDRPIKVNTDGQVFETSQCDYGVTPRAVRFMVPSREMRAAASEARESGSTEARAHADK